ncbi:MAG: orotate phosphoribosyltransferase [Microbacteriaceae bacterium]|nr:orotate phosphoribosyltransferase [Microbacteriaceae bacterium]
MVASTWASHATADCASPKGVCPKVVTVTDARQQLIDYISADAVFHGDFTLTSGKKATYYVDLRKVSLDHRVAPLIGQVMLDLIADIPDVSAVGGLTMGADPVAAAILHQGAARGAAYDAFVVRKEPKDHGRGKQVEGPDLSGKRVIVIEDTSTTGGSPLKAIEALLKVGAEIAGVAVVVDRNTGAREIIEAAGYPYFAAIGLEDLGLA